jgi:DNA-binding transcriptional ArsR family regulator
MAEIDDIQAEFLKTLAHPRRLQILHRLADGPISVARLATDLGMSQPNASQHLAVMRSAGVVDAERDGREVRYRIADPDIVVACGIARTVLERRFERLAGLTVAPAAPAPTIEADEPTAVLSR